MTKLSHFNEKGYAKMVDVGQKAITDRSAVASGMVFMRPETLSSILENGMVKGDVFAVAQVAGIMAAKKTADLIPMCHPLMIANVEMAFENKVIDGTQAAIKIIATVKTTGQTGVEMEAMTAVCVAALTVYDMCKAIDKEISIGPIGLVSKSGGKSGPFHRSTPL